MSGFNPRKFPVKESSTAAQHCKDYGPTFGRGHDLSIRAGRENSVSKPVSYAIPQLCSIIGNDYCAVQTLQIFYSSKGEKDQDQWSSFNADEVEVFYAWKNLIKHKAA